MGLSHAGGVDKRHVQSQWLRPIPELLWPARMSTILKFYSRSGDSASAEHAPTSDGSSRPDRRSSCAGAFISDLCMPQLVMLMHRFPSWGGQSHKHCRLRPLEVERRIVKPRRWGLASPMAPPAIAARWPHPSIWLTYVRPKSEWRSSGRPSRFTCKRPSGDITTCASFGRGLFVITLSSPQFQKPMRALTLRQRVSPSFVRWKSLFAMVLRLRKYCTRSWCLVERAVKPKSKGRHEQDLLVRASRRCRGMHAYW